MFDTDKGYNSCGYLDRIARTSDQLSEKENDQEIERAIDEIIKYDFMNLYRKVKRDIASAWRFHAKSECDATLDNQKSAINHAK